MSRAARRQVQRFTLDQGRHTFIGKTMRYLCFFVQVSNVSRTLEF